MAILLIHETDSEGMAALPAESIAGEPTPARRYIQEGYLLNIDGAERIVTHDVATLLEHGYRLATAEEQNEYASRKKKTRTIKETSSKEVGG